jgi:hypothetical protein
MVAVINYWQYPGNSSGSDVADEVIQLNPIKFPSPQWLGEDQGAGGGGTDVSHVRWTDMPMEKQIEY